MKRWDMLTAKLMYLFFSAARVVNKRLLSLAPKSVIHRDFSKHQNCGRENITFMFVPALAFLMILTIYIELYICHDVVLYTDLSYAGAKPA